MEESAGAELRDVLSKRRDVLEAIRDVGKTKPELVDEMKHSRSTIDRAIEELSDADCIVRVDRSVQASPVGRTALQANSEYIETSDGIRSAAPVLTALSPDDPVHHVMFRGAEVHVADPQTPQLGISRSNELTMKATDFRGYASVVLEEYFDMQTEKLREDDFQSEIIIEHGLYDQIRTHFADEYDRLVEQDGVTIYVTDRMLTYSPWIMVLPANTYAGMTVYDDGAIRGVIINDSADAIAWVQELLSSLMDSATEPH